MLFSMTCAWSGLDLADFDLTEFETKGLEGAWVSNDCVAGIFCDIPYPLFDISNWLIFPVQLRDLATPEVLKVDVH